MISRKKLAGCSAFAESRMLPSPIEPDHLPTRSISKNSALSRHRARQRQHENVFRASFSQRAAAFVHRRAGSVDVIDQQNFFARHRTTGSDSKRTAHVAPPLFFIELGLRRGFFDVVAARMDPVAIA